MTQPTGFLQLVFEVNRASHDILRKLSTEVGLTPVELEVLYALHQDANIGVAQLANQLTVSCGTVSGVVDRLVRNQFVTREYSTLDRRRIALKLTESGHQKMIELVSQSSVYEEQCATANDFHQGMQHLLSSHKNEDNDTGRNCQK